MYKRLQLLLSILLLSINCFSQIITDTILTYPTVGLTTNGAPGITFELETSKVIHLKKLLIYFSRSGPHNVEIFYRNGGVQHIQGNLPYIDTSNGWINAGTYNNNIPMINSLVGTSGDMNLFLKPGKYGFFISDFNESDIGYGFYSFGDQSSFPTSISSVKIVTGTNASYIGGGPNSSTSNIYSLSDTFAFNGGLIYDEIPYFMNDVAIKSIDSTIGKCGSTDMIITVQNHGSNQITSLTINWKLDGVLQTPFLYSGLLDTIGGGQAFEKQIKVGSFNNVLSSGHQIEVWTSLPNGNQDLNPSNDSLIEIIKPGLSGLYTINPAGLTTNNFTSFVSAAKELRERGVCNDVIFMIAPGTYSDHLYLDNLLQTTNSDRSITFNGGDASLVELTYSSSNDSATVLLQGTDYIVFKNMTISNTSSTDAWGIMLQDEADHITIDSCRFELPINSTTDRIAVIASNSMSGEQTGSNANYLTISNCSFIGGEAGITIDGPANKPFTTGYYIANNTFRFQDDHAIELDGLDSILVKYNNIDSLRNPGAEAIYCLDIDRFDFSFNKIFSPGTALRISDGNQDFSHLNNKSIIYNNFIKSDTEYGMFFLTELGFTDILHNTVLGDPALRISSQHHVNILNNIFFSDVDFALYALDPFGPSDTVDYNLYYNSSSHPLFEVDDFVYDKLVQWQVADKRNNRQSYHGNPNFKSPTDLHVFGWSADSKAKLIPGITTDIDADPRTTRRDIGADEFIPLDTCLAPGIVLVDTVTPASALLRFEQDTVLYNVEWGPCGFQQGTGSNGYGVDSINLTGLNSSACYDVYIRRFCGKNNTYTNYSGPFSFITTCGTPLAGTYTVNKSQPSSNTNFRSFSAAAEALNNCGVSSAVIFNVAPDLYEESFTLNQITGSSSANTITFTGDSSNTTITHDGSISTSVISLDGADWVTLKGLRIINSLANNNDACGISYRNGSDDLTIEECAIEMAQNSLTSGAYINRGIGTLSSIHNGNDIRILNNTIKNGGRAIGIYGDFNSPAKNIYIEGNRFVDNEVNGISLSAFINCEISNNIIEGAGIVSNINPDYIKSGIVINNTVADSVLINNNHINVISSGIILTGRGSSILSASNGVIYNNMITSLKESAGLYLQHVQNINVMHNTIKSASNGAILLSNVHNSKIVNNNFVSDSGIVFENTFNQATNNTIDFNNYFSTVASTPLSREGSVSYSSLSNWQSAHPSYNWQSISVDPLFVGINDLHAAAPLLNNRGDSLGILSDIDGDPRSLLFPDIGADEFILPCMLSSNGVASNITPANAILNWTSGYGNRFNIEFGLSGYPQGTGNQIKSVQKPYLLTGLSPATSYDFYIQDSCGTEGASAWAGPFTFITPQGLCAAPSQLGADTLSTTSVQINWTSGGASNWNVEYGPQGFTLGTGTFLYNTLNDTLILSGLLGSNCYDYYVQDSCGVGYVSTWVGPFTFCTDTCKTSPAGQNISIDACVSDGFISLAPLIGKHQGGGSWIKITPSAALFDSTFSTVATQFAGMYKVAYVISNPGCPVDSAVVTINLSEEPNAGTPTSVTLCDSLGTVNLSNYLGNFDAGGSWIDLDGSGGLTGANLDLSVPANKRTYRYKYLIDGGGCPNDSAIVTVHIASCFVGIEDQVFQNFKLYPNPTTNVLTVHFTAPSSKAIVYISDAAGKIVLQKDIQSTNDQHLVQLSLKNLAVGIYTLRIQSGNFTRIEKFVKN